MAWLHLITTEILEIVWTYSMKQSKGSMQLIPTTLVAMIASFALLAATMRTLPYNTAYTAWTLIRAVAAFILGAGRAGSEASPIRASSAFLSSPG
jgi:quaternary ammonium compound-resistance protein SugE